MSGFSSALKLTDLNDFIQPSQVCIKPTETFKNTKCDPINDEEDIIKINKENKWKNRQIKSEPRETSQLSKLATVSVNLSDCLACSGCITSAEAVLISEQSNDKVLQVLKEKQEGLNNFIIILTMSLQALASLAAKYRSTIQSTAEHLCHFFHNQLGIDYILDISLARHICLYEGGRELLQHKKEKQPIISSTCPGFVCYSEKSQGSTLVPLLSRIKSPQQIMGLLVKQRLHLIDSNKTKISVDTKRIYHITLMPCYDKKLEASRIENKLGPEIAEVDCVLTPIEIEKILEFKQIKNLNSLPTRQLDHFLTSYNFDSNIYSHFGSGSGGYAENLFWIVAKHHHLLDVSSKQALHWKMVRNTDFLEMNLYENGQINPSESDSKQPILSFAILNGFRNIQNLVSQLKRKTCTYDYIEVSACPKGCLNGGAQFRNLPHDPDRNQSIPDSDPVLITYEQVQSLYNELPKTEFDIDDAKINQLYEELQLDEQFRQQFRTEFKILEKKFNVLNSNW